MAHGPGRRDHACLLLEQVSTSLPGLPAFLPPSFLPVCLSACLSVCPTFDACLLTLGPCHTYPLYQIDRGNQVGEIKRKPSCTCEVWCNSRRLEHGAAIKRLLTLPQCIS